MDKPRIAILPEYDPTLEPDSGKFPVYRLRMAVVDEVKKAGGLPLILPFTNEGDIPRLLEGFAGVIVSGNAMDLHPETYGQRIEHRIDGPDELRAGFEIALLKHVLAADMPLFAICGGMQTLNVVLGGTLYQDLAAQAPRAMDHEQKFDRRRPLHKVVVEPDSILGKFLAGLPGGDLWVNSTHHQAVERAAEGIRVTARAEDGVVEAFEVPDRKYIHAVQWHPELLDVTNAGPQLFSDFLAACNQ